MTGRPPLEKEKELLDDFYQDELVNFQLNKANALAYLDTGEKPWDRQLNPTEIAALGVVVNSIMNTTEAYSKK